MWLITEAIIAIINVDRNGDHRYSYILICIDNYKQILVHRHKHFIQNIFVQSRN